MSVFCWNGWSGVELTRSEWRCERSRAYATKRLLPLRPARRASRLVPLKEDSDALIKDVLSGQAQEQNDDEDENEDDGSLRFFATCAPGLEPVVAGELQAPAVGALNVKVGTCGVYFKGGWQTGFRANLWSRSAVRVLQLIASSDLSKQGGGDSDAVYEFVKHAVDWRKFLVAKGGEFRSFSVQSRVWDCTEISNSLLASTRAKDGICDALRSSCGGERPEPPASHASADVPLFLSLYKDRALLYRDLSGFSLHMRGYREAMHKASLNEGVAAGVLTIAGWNRYVPGFGTLNKNTAESSQVLLDPMCGSGTFLIEAALMAMNIAPGVLRKEWPFMSWHDFEKKVWRECYREAESARVEAPPNMQLLGNDVHEGAVMLCSRDAERAGVKRAIKLSCEDCRRHVPHAQPSLVVVNPPWGNRLQEEEPSLLATYMGLGRFLKKRCNQADVYLLSGNSTLSRQLQMKADRKWPLTVGGLDCRLLHYYVLPPKDC